jgi:5-methylcytosine-specific restriction endonuclease McrA
MTTTRKCTDCNKEYPATLEYFHASTKGKYGLRSLCKVCLCKAQMDYMKSKTPQDKYELKRAEQQRNKHTYRQARRKASALQRGVHHEKWTEKQLDETYGTDCYICNKAIDFSAPRTGQGSQLSSWPDHVIPLSRGGEDTIRNVRPCHRKCNQAKYTMTYDEFINSDRYESL